MPKVSVWIRENGTRRYVKAHPKQFYPPNTIFCLRYVKAGRRKWETIINRGPIPMDVRLATAKARIREADLLIEKPDPVKMAERQRKSIEASIERYLEDVKATKAKKTLQEYTADLARFTESCRKSFFLDEITVDDLQSFVRFLRAEGLSKRTVYNIFQSCNTFLRVNEIMLGGKILKKLGQEYEEKVVTAYTPEELRALFEACNADERLVFRFFLVSGCREGEVAHTEWRDLNFADNTLHVQPKPEWGWKVKDREDRYVPMEDNLMAELKARRNGAKANDLVFPNTEGRPEGHFLRQLQAIARDAGLDGKWEVHKFRRSFACMHSDANVPLRALQGWLGHSSLAFDWEGPDRRYR